MSVAALVLTTGLVTRHDGLAALDDAVRERNAHRRVRGNHVACRAKLRRACNQSPQRARCNGGFGDLQRPHTHWRRPGRYSTPAVTFLRPGREVTVLRRYPARRSAAMSAKKARYR